MRVVIGTRLRTTQTIDHKEPDAQMDFTPDDNLQKIRSCKLLSKGSGVTTSGHIKSKLCKTEAPHCQFPKFSSEMFAYSLQISL